MLRCRPLTSATTLRSKFACRHTVQVYSSKGFSTDEPKKASGNDEPPQSTSTQATASSSSTDSLDALEARIKSRRARKVGEAKVKVVSPVVDEVTGKTPATPQSQAESAYVAGLSFLFLAVIVEGLVLAGSGFLPEDWDAFVTDSLYPSYSPTVVLFLIGSSIYGLYKTGKLPGMTQQ